MTMNLKPHQRLSDEFWNPGGAKLLEDEPIQSNIFNRGSAVDDPYNPSFAKTDVSALQKLNGGLIDNGGKLDKQKTVSHEK